MTKRSKDTVPDPPEYEITIVRRVPNEAWEEPRSILHAPYNETTPRYLEESVTRACLTERQWRLVQRAIVEGIE